MFEPGIETLPYGALRELRLHHWKRARNASKLLPHYEAAVLSSHVHYPKAYYEARVSELKTEWSFHIGAVQTLNEFFDTTIGDTAERDEEQKELLTKSERRR